MENLKKFNTQEEYQEWKDGDDYVYPNVCKVGDEVIYNGYPDYFWIEALEDLKVWQGRIIGSSNEVSRDSSTMSYSKDKETWNRFTVKEPWVFVRKGEKIYFRSTYIPDQYNEIGKFYIIGKCNIGGSILSLIYGDDYLTQRTPFNDSIFNRLFSVNALGVDYNQIISAIELIFPDYTSIGCYGSMFSGCKDLVNPPRLPSKNLFDSCYSSMFFGCSSLVEAPTLPAIAVGGYAGLFRECSSLSYIKMLGTTNFGGDASYSWSRNWVKGVSPTGTFIASAKRTDFTRGPHGIPEGWDLYLYDVDNDRYVVKFKVNGIPYEFYTDEPRDITWQEFIDSDKNTNGFKVASTEFNNPVKFGSDYVLRNNEKVAGQYYIILNESYTIGQPTTTTEE